jgi:hypothetical protein
MSPVPAGRRILHHPRLGERLLHVMSVLAANGAAHSFRPRNPKEVELPEGPERVAEKAEVDAENGETVY